jgi:hypothetical protein
MARCCSPTSSPPPARWREPGPAPRRPGRSRSCSAARARTRSSRSPPWLAGEPRQGRLGVGRRTLSRPAHPVQDGVRAGRGVVADRSRGRPGPHRGRRDDRAGFRGTARRARRSTAVRRHPGGAAVPRPPAHRRAPPGRPRGGRAGCRRLRGRRPRSRRAPGLHASGRLPGTAVTALTGGVDGRDLLDEPLHVRLDTLAHLLAADEHAPLRMPGVRGRSPEQASGVLDDALAAGHQGVVVKALDAPYAAGRRGWAGRRSSPCTPSTSS